MKAPRSRYIVLLIVLLNPLHSALAVSGGDLLPLLPTVFSGQKMTNSSKSNKDGEPNTFATAWYEKGAKISIADGTTHPGTKNKAKELLAIYRGTKDAMNMTMDPIVTWKPASKEIEVYGFTAKGAAASQKVNVVAILKERYIVMFDCEKQDRDAVTNYLRQFPLQALPSNL